MSPHIHSAVEVLFVVKGEFQIFADNEELLAQEGSTVLFRSNTIHRIYRLGAEDSAYYVFKFSPSLIIDLSSPEYRSLYLLQLAINTQNGKVVWSAEESETNGLHRALELLIGAEKEQDYGSDIAMKLGAASVLLSLLRDLLPSNLPLSLSELPGDVAVRRIYDVTVYINSHYAEPITAADCAAMAYMSYSYFSRCFYRIMGKSFKEYLNLTRINRAEKALLGSDRSVTDIACECGFNSVSYFISIYRKIKGMTPLQLRNGRPHNKLQ